MDLMILNDLHISATRKGGTTPETQAGIRRYLQDSFREFIGGMSPNHLVINGDFFDAFTVEPMEVAVAYDTLAEWLHASPDRLLTMVQGNHDWNPRGDKLSSFHLLCHFLVSRYGNHVVRVIDQGFSPVVDGVWAIPHMPNQDLFDMEIEKAVESGYGGSLLLHCNYCSTFAEHSDHSLNVSIEQVNALASAGWHLVIAHEHQGRELPHATIIGNQWPSSISDCLSHGPAQKDGTKYALLLSGGERQRVPTWHAAEDYIEMDWRELDLNTPARFVRITGAASSAEAEDAMSAVARYRQKSKAFIVGNAVKVEGVSIDLEGFEGSTQEAIKSFDVLSALLEELTPEEGRVVREVMV